MSEEEKSKSDGEDPQSPLEAKIYSLAALHALKANPQVAADFVSSLLKSPEVSGRVFRTRPKGPYYTKIRALELKPFLDRMIQDQKPIAFYTKRFKVSSRSLWLRIHQSFDYLAENIEIIQLYGTKYKELREYTKLCTENRNRENPAIVIRFREDPEATPIVPLTDDAVENLLPNNEWKLVVDRYLEDISNTESLNIKGLNLTDEQVSELDYELSSLEGILATVTSTNIKIIKFSGGQK